VPKKPSKTTQAKGPQPQPAQLKAVENLIRGANFPQAIERARALVQRFPDHGTANQMLVDALYHNRDRGGATLAAYQWAQRRPNSPAAL
jgi:hypothetical protein